MAASFRFGNIARRCCLYSVLLAATIGASPLVRANELVVVHLDQARITRLPEHVSTIVIGNPLIADASLQAGGLMVLTGKGYGVTNLVALDRGGNVLTEITVQVQSATDGIVIVYRGDARESYICTPNCEPRIMLGDTPTYFDAVMAQAGTRTTRAQGAGSTAGTGSAPNVAAR